MSQLSTLFSQAALRFIAITAVIITCPLSMSRAGDADNPPSPPFDLIVTHIDFKSGKIKYHLNSTCLEKHFVNLDALNEADFSITDKSTGEACTGGGVRGIGVMPKDKLYFILYGTETLPPKDRERGVKSRELDLTIEELANPEWHNSSVVIHFHVHGFNHNCSKFVSQTIKVIIQISSLDNKLTWKQEQACP